MTTAVKTKWLIDQHHSQIQFKVRHLMISNVAGNFRSFQGSVHGTSETFEDAAIKFELDTNSIDTHQPERDGHLKSAMFLNVDKFPKIIFEGTLKRHDEDMVLAGDLTICGVTRSVELLTEVTGVGAGRFGDTRAGFEVNGKINRRDFGLDFSLLTETGSMVVGEEVKLHFDVQLVRA